MKLKRNKSFKNDEKNHWQIIVRVTFACCEARWESRCAVAEDGAIGEEDLEGVLSCATIPCLSSRSWMNEGSEFDGVEDERLGVVRRRRLGHFCFRRL